ncbi:MAG: hypothetical protein NTZ05_11695 [Chloroflexi bacterium]|nr:hypothetical protein [Chloroflexota bacterium]
MSEVVTAAERKELRAAHSQDMYFPNPPTCRTCRHRLPCPTIRALDALDSESMRD